MHFCWNTIGKKKSNLFSCTYCLQRLNPGENCSQHCSSVGFFVFFFRKCLAYARIRWHICTKHARRLDFWGEMVNCMVVQPLQQSVHSVFWFGLIGLKITGRKRVCNTKRASENLSLLMILTTVGQVFTWIGYLRCPWTTFPITVERSSAMHTVFC